MGLKRQIDTDYWTDIKVQSFTSGEKYFMLYCLSSPKSNSSGCYEISLDQMAFDTKMSIDSLKKVINKFNEEYKNILYSYETSEIFIVNYAKHNWRNSPKLDQSLREFICSIKCYEFHDNLARLFNDRKSLEKSNTERIPLRNGENVIPISYGYDTNMITNTKTKSITKTKSNANAYSLNANASSLNDSDVFTKEELEEDIKKTSVMSMEDWEIEMDMQF